MGYIMEGDRGENYKKEMVELVVFGTLLVAP
jgi:hypothetical protein